MVGEVWGRRWGRLHMRVDDEGSVCAAVAAPPTLHYVCVCVCPHDTTGLIGRLKRQEKSSKNVEKRVKRN